jgi:hypothetical protein
LPVIKKGFLHAVFACIAQSIHFIYKFSTMKNLLFTILFFACAIALTAQSTEELAIQKVCEAETRAWLAKDATTFNDCWQIRPYSRIVMSGDDGQTMSIGSDQMKPRTAETIFGNGGTFVNTNYQIHVEGNTAWAMYDSVKTDDTGKHPSYEVRMMEKVNGAWKIVCMSVHHYKAK